MPLQSKDWEDWFHHPCTQQFIVDLQGNRQEVLEFIAGGGTVDSGNGDTTLQLTAKEVGRAHAIREVIELIEACKAEEKDDGARDSDE